MTQKVTPANAYTELRFAGLSKANAALLTAIGGAESGWDVDAVGDVGLEDAKWGPSVGVWQIRTLKADTGTGSPRDINKLRGNLAAQAKAAAAIFKASGARAWSTYKNGSYLKYEGQVPTVSTSVKPPPAGSIDPGPAASSSTGATSAQAVGFPGGGWDPLNWPGAIAGNLGGQLASGVTTATGKAVATVAGGIWASVHDFAITGMFALGGIALVVVGLSMAAAPARRGAEGAALQVAPLVMA